MTRSGSHDLRRGPWPEVSIDGELDRAEREFLHTNGAGAYAMSTLALKHTRRHHGLLVASLESPIDRWVILSHAETTVTVPGRVFKLSTHQFPGVAPTLGYRNLKTFAQDPLPRWSYRLGKGVLERTLALARGTNAVVLRYRWLGNSAARISLMPLMPMRRVERLAREHGGMKQKVTLRPNAVEVQPVLSIPPIVFSHRGVFMGSPDWWRRFEYTEDLRRYPDFQEDMWTPGTFEMSVEPDGDTYLVAALGALPDGTPEEIMEEARRHLLAQDPGPEASPIQRTLSVAADSFACDASPRPVIVAGYPWLGVSFRDWLIALPGITLARGRLAEAKHSLAEALRWMRGGLLPRELPSAGARRVPSPDATLWLFEAARAVAERCGLEDPFVQRMLFPSLVRAFLRLKSRRIRKGAWVNDAGFDVHRGPRAGDLDGCPGRRPAGHPAQWPRHRASSALVLCLQAALGVGSVLRSRATGSRRRSVPGPRRRGLPCALLVQRDRLPLRLHELRARQRGLVGGSERSVPTRSSPSPWHRSCSSRGRPTPSSRA